MIDESDRFLLLRIAREALTEHLCGISTATLQLTGAAALPAGAFVTLYRDKELRGCIGHIEASDALGRIVARCAIAAATADPRFPPLSASELSGVHIEVSVLGPLQLVAAIDEIEVGRHGLVVEMGWRRGLLLPQVATEWGWNRRTFLEHTCRKAGLSRDAWRQGATIWKFEAQVFGEPRTEVA